jgi:hypothetical protein
MNNKNAPEDYVLKMKEKFITSILDFLILYLLAFDSMEDISPYSIRNILRERWDWFNPPLPTIYSRIERLEKNEIIDSSMVLVGARGKKIMRETISNSVLEAKALILWDVSIISPMNESQTIKLLGFNESIIDVDPSQFIGDNPQLVLWSYIP